LRLWLETSLRGRWPVQPIPPFQPIQPVQRIQPA